MRIVRRALLCLWLASELLLAATPAAASECPAMLLEMAPIHTDADTGRVVRTVPLSLHPEGAGRTFLYGKAHVLALGQRCSLEAEENVLTLYEPDGRVRWSLGMEELLPGRTRVQRGFYRWYEAVRRLGTDIDQGASIVLVVQNYDEVRVRLRDGAVTLRSVPVSELGDDAVKLKARALYLGRIEDREGKERLLRRVLARNPRDYEVVASLAELLSRKHLPLQSAALWRDLESQLPLPELPEQIPRFALMPGVPSITEMRYRQAAFLKEAQSYQAAFDLVAERLRAGIEEARLWHLQAELQLALGRGADAKASFDRQIAMVARRVLTPALVGREASPQEYYHAVDSAAESLEVAGYASLGTALRQHPAAQAEVIADFRAQALQSRDRDHANQLGRIYVGADTTGDFREAIQWYTLAADRPGTHLDTEAELALCHLHRHSGARPDYAMALQYCDAAIERGSVPARFWAGMLRLTGSGASRDEAAGLALLASALASDEYHQSFAQSLPEQRRSFGTAEDFRWAVRVLGPYAADGNVMVAKVLQEIRSSYAWQQR